MVAAREGVVTVMDAKSRHGNLGETALVREQPSTHEKSFDRKSQRALLFSAAT
jgi:hypothetical protein